LKDGRPDGDPDLAGGIAANEHRCASWDAGRSHGKRDAAMVLADLRDSAGSLIDGLPILIHRDHSNPKE
jgi:hypothetical protein